MRWRWVDWGPERVTEEDWGPVLEATRPERYVFRWQNELGGTTVEVDFADHADGTVVRLREHGYPDTRAGWAGFSGLLERLGRSADAVQVPHRARLAVLTPRIRLVALVLPVPENVL